MAPLAIGMLRKAQYQRRDTNPAPKTTHCRRSAFVVPTMSALLYGFALYCAPPIPQGHLPAAHEHVLNAGHHVSISSVSTTLDVHALQKLGRLGLLMNENHDSQDNPRNESQNESLSRVEGQPPLEDLTIPIPDHPLPFSQLMDMSKSFASSKDVESAAGSQKAHETVMKENTDENQSVHNDSRVISDINVSKHSEGFSQQSANPDQTQSSAGIATVLGHLNNESKSMIHQEQSSVISVIQPDHTSPFLPDHVESDMLREKDDDESSHYTDLENGKLLSQTHEQINQMAEQNTSQNHSVAVPQNQSLSESRIVPNPNHTSPFLASRDEDEALREKGDDEPSNWTAFVNGELLSQMYQQINQTGVQNIDPSQNYDQSTSSVISSIHGPPVSVRGFEQNSAWSSGWSQALKSEQSVPQIHGQNTVSSQNHQQSSVISSIHGPPVSAKGFEQDSAWSSGWSQVLKSEQSVPQILGQNTVSSQNHQQAFVISSIYGPSVFVKGFEQDSAWSSGWSQALKSEQSVPQIHGQHLLAKPQQKESDFNWQQFNGNHQKDFNGQKQQKQQKKASGEQIITGNHSQYNTSKQLPPQQHGAKGPSSLWNRPEKGTLVETKSSSDIDPNGVLKGDLELGSLYEQMGQMNDQERFEWLMGLPDEKRQQLLQRYGFVQPSAKPPAKVHQNSSQRLPSNQNRRKRGEFRTLQERRSERNRREGRAGRNKRVRFPGVENSDNLLRTGTTKSSGSKTQSRKGRSQHTDSSGEAESDDLQSETEKVTAEEGENNQTRRSDNEEEEEVLHGETYVQSTEKRDAEDHPTNQTIESELAPPLVASSKLVSGASSMSSHPKDEAPGLSHEKDNQDQQAAEHHQLREKQRKENRSEEDHDSKKEGQAATQEAKSEGLGGKVDESRGEEEDEKGDPPSEEKLMMKELEQTNHPRPGTVEVRSEELDWPKKKVSGILQIQNSVVDHTDMENQTENYNSQIMMDNHQMENPLPYEAFYLLFKCKLGGIKLGDLEQGLLMKSRVWISMTKELLMRAAESHPENHNDRDPSSDPLDLSRMNTKDHPFARDQSQEKQVLEDTTIRDSYAHYQSYHRETLKAAKKHSTIQGIQKFGQTKIGEMNGQKMDFTAAEVKSALLLADSHTSQSSAFSQSVQTDHRKEFDNLKHKSIHGPDEKSSHESDEPDHKSYREADHKSSQLSANRAQSESPSQENEKQSQQAPEQSELDEEGKKEGRSEEHQHSEKRDPSDMQGVKLEGLGGKVDESQGEDEKEDPRAEGKLMRNGMEQRNHPQPAKPVTNEMEQSSHPEPDTVEIQVEKFRWNQELSGTFKIQNSDACRHLSLEDKPLKEYSNKQIIPRTQSSKDEERPRLELPEDYELRAGGKIEVENYSAFHVHGVLLDGSEVVATGAGSVVQIPNSGQASGKIEIANEASLDVEGKLLGGEVIATGAGSWVGLLGEASGQIQIRNSAELWIDGKLSETASVFAEGARTTVELRQSATLAGKLFITDHATLKVHKEFKETMNYDDIIAIKNRNKLLKQQKTTDLEHQLENLNLNETNAQPSLKNAGLDDLTVRIGDAKVHLSGSARVVWYDVLGYSQEVEADTEEDEEVSQPKDDPHGEAEKPKEEGAELVQNDNPPAIPQPCGSQNEEQKHQQQQSEPQMVLEQQPQIQGPMSSMNGVKKENENALGVPAKENLMTNEMEHSSHPEPDTCEIRVEKLDSSKREVSGTFKIQNSGACQDVLIEQKPLKEYANKQIIPRTHSSEDKERALLALPKNHEVRAGGKIEIEDYSDFRVGGALLEGSELVATGSESRVWIEESGKASGRIEIANGARLYVWSQLVAGEVMATGDSSKVLLQRSGKASGNIRIQNSAILWIEGTLSGTASVFAQGGGTKVELGDGAELAGKLFIKDQATLGIDDIIALRMMNQEDIIAIQNRNKLVENLKLKDALKEAAPEDLTFQIGDAKVHLSGSVLVNFNLC